MQVRVQLLLLHDLGVMYHQHSKILMGPRTNMAGRGLRQYDGQYACTGHFTVSCVRHTCCVREFRLVTQPDLLLLTQRIPALCGPKLHSA